MRAPTELQDQPPRTPMRGVSFCANAPVHEKYIHPPESGERHARPTSAHRRPPFLPQPFIHAISSHVPCSTLAPSAAFPSPPHFLVAYMKPMDDDERRFDLH